ncbi:hypothetical protein SAMN05192541_101361 [Bradyrhizobium arachidis]|nr:hypothetical protein SAMN05192541_101361 [Bradyrhizobium arachidis]
MSSLCKCNHSDNYNEPDVSGVFVEIVEIPSMKH